MKSLLLIMLLHYSSHPEHRKVSANAFVTNLLPKTLGDNGGSVGIRSYNQTR